MTSRYTKAIQNWLLKHSGGPGWVSRIHRSQLQLSCVLLFSLISLSSCFSGLFNDKLDQYAQLMERNLGISIPSPPTLTLHYPSRKLLESTISQTTINFSEFNDLNKCGAATLIAQRNTALGKVQLPSQRFIYEVKLLESLQECRQHFTDQALLKRVDQLIDIKQSNLSGVWSNLLLLSEETKLQFASNQVDFIEMDSTQVNLVVEALNYLNHLQFASNNTEELEAQLNTLRQYPLLAAGWRMQVKSQFLLSKMNESVSEVLKKSTCGSAPIEVINQYRNNLAPSFEALLHLFSRTQLILQAWLNNNDLADEFRTYISNKLASTEEFKRSLAQHEILLDQYTKACLTD